MKTKICTQCKIEKDIKDFYPSKNKYSKDGFVWICKFCCKENRHQYYLENKSQRDKANKKYIFALTELYFL